MKNLNGHEFLLIPEGISFIGSDKRDPFASHNEFPLKEVYLSTFKISRYVTTVEQLYEFCQQTGTPFPRSGRSKEPTGARIDASQSRVPATGVSWELAWKYCSWLSEHSGLRVVLPTEAEWEKAARGDDRIWPWGNEFDSEKCNSMEDGGATIKAVDAVPCGASPFGCEQMAGGVWEWCQDFHHYQAHQSTDYLNPVNIVPGPRRVVKGGSAFCTKEIVRPACRDWTNSYNQGGGDDGFRVAIRL